MLRLAVEAGYPSVRRWLAAEGGITWREHRELTDLLAVEPVGGERLDWHFARLMMLLDALLAKHEDDEPLAVKEWLIEALFNPPPEEEPDEDLFRAVVTGMAAMFGGEIAPLSGQPEE